MIENPFAHEWDNVTTLHPLGLLAVVVLGLTMWLVPRRYAVIPMIIMASIIAPAQRVVILEFDFNLLRIMVLFGWARLLLRNEFRGFIWKPIDYVFVAWAIIGSVAYVLLFGSVAAFVNRLGYLYDALGMYFLFRFLIRSWSDVERLAVSVALISIPVAAIFMIEKTTGYNIFAMFGGVPEITIERYGKLRAQGAFPHPIIAGVFWAALLPLIAVLWKWGRWRWLAIMGTVTSVAIVVATASSTPLAAVAAAVTGAVIFRIRKWMRWLRWGLVLFLIGFHLVMPKPIWYLLTKIDLVGGSTGWHRYNLIDQAVNRFNEWWLIGTPSTDRWGWYLFDLANQYVAEGVRGGILTLLLFVLIIALGFQGVGRACQALERDQRRHALAWAVGVSLFVHSTAFIGVSYFGQIILIWYLLLGIIGSLTPVRMKTFAPHYRGFTHNPSYLKISSLVARTEASGRRD